MKGKHWWFDVWLCTSGLFSCKSQRWLNRDNLETTFFLRGSFCYPKPVKSLVLKYKMEVLHFNRQLRCYSACLAREIVPGHDTNLIFFLVSTAFIYFLFFFLKHLSLSRSWRPNLWIHRPPIYLQFLISSKRLSTKLLTEFNSFFIKQYLTLKCVTNLSITDLRHLALFLGFLAILGSAQ